MKDTLAVHLKARMESCQGIDKRFEFSSRLTTLNLEELGKVAKNLLNFITMTLLQKTYLWKVYIEGNI